MKKLEYINRISQRLINAIPKCNGQSIALLILCLISSPIITASQDIFPIEFYRPAAIVSAIPTEKIEIETSVRLGYEGLNYQLIASPSNKVVLFLTIQHNENFPKVKFPGMQNLFILGGNESLYGELGGGYIVYLSEAILNVGGGYGFGRSQHDGDIDEGRVRYHKVFGMTNLSYPTNFATFSALIRTSFIKFNGFDRRYFFIEPALEIKPRIWKIGFPLQFGYALPVHKNSGLATGDVALPIFSIGLSYNFIVGKSD
ncbi:MAG: hypothetical protein AAF502_16210 [Bacteroidota bacterium]